MQALLHKQGLPKRLSEAICQELHIVNTPAAQLKKVCNHLTPSQHVLCKLSASQTSGSTGSVHKISWNNPVMLLESYSIVHILSSNTHGTSQALKIRGEEGGGVETFRAPHLLIMLTRRSPLPGLFGHMSNMLRLEVLRPALQACLCTCAYAACGVLLTT